MDLNFNLKTLIMICLIILLGIMSSWSDVKNRKISNKLVLGFLIIGIILNLYNSVSDFRINYFVNLLFAVFIGFFLWYVNFWNAGDGKLFLTFVSLIPISMIFTNKTYLYSYQIIFYTFVPVFFVFLLFLLFQTTKKELLFALKKSWNIKTIFLIIIAFLSFQWVIQLFNIYFGLRMNLFISAVVLFFVFDGLEKILKIKLIYLFYITAALRIIFDFSNVVSVDFLLYFIYQVSIFLVFVYFFLYVAYFKFGVHVKIPDLKPGMNLSEKIIKRGDKYMVIPDVKISLFMFMHDAVEQKLAIEMKPEGLSKEQIIKIQNWNKKEQIEVGALLIQKRIPYAPFQFFGVIILIIKSFLG